MIKIVVSFLLFFSLGFAQDITPVKEIVVKGTAKDMVLYHDRLI